MKAIAIITGIFFLTVCCNPAHAGGRTNHATGIGVGQGGDAEAAALALAEGGDALSFSGVDFTSIDWTQVSMDTKVKLYSTIKNAIDNRMIDNSVQQAYAEAINGNVNGEFENVIEAYNEGITATAESNPHLSVNTPKPLPAVTPLPVANVPVPQLEDLRRIGEIDMSKFTSRFVPAPKGKGIGRYGEKADVLSTWSLSEDAMAHGKANKDKPNTVVIRKLDPDDKVDNVEGYVLGMPITKKANLIPLDQAAIQSAVRLQNKGFGGLTLIVDIDNMEIFVGAKSEGTETSTGTTVSDVLWTQTVAAAASKLGHAEGSNIGVWVEKGCFAIKIPAAQE